MIIIIMLITILVLAAIVPAADAIITYRRKRKESDEIIDNHMDVKTLEQVSCEDAISRQMISDYVEGHILEINTGYGDLNKHTNEILRMIVDYIEKMESVTPQPKAGYWIKVDDEEPLAWDCSCCDAMVSREYDYCPICGARMKGNKE